MTLRDRIRRWRYVYGWRWRHWWLDTHAGRVTQLTAGMCVVIAIAAGVVHHVVAAALHPEQPHQAVLWWVVWLVVTLVVSLYLALTASKPAAQKSDQQITTPTTKDGQSAVRHYGTVWIDSPAMLAWKVTGRDPIKTKSGGKK